MSNTITVKGFIIQTIWSPALSVSPHGDYDTNQYNVCHRPFEIEIPVSSLRFDPTDLETRDKIMLMQTIASKELEKTEHYNDIAKLDEELKQLTCLEAPAPDDEEVPF